MRVVVSITRVRLLLSRHLECEETATSIERTASSVRDARPGCASPISSRQASVAAALRAAVDGLGLTFSFEEYVAPQITSGALVRVLKDWCPPFPGYFLYYPTRRQQPAALSALIDTLRLEDRNK